MFEKNMTLSTIENPSGTVFHELSKDEMNRVAGGQDIQPLVSSSCVIVSTVVTTLSVVSVASSVSSCRATC